VQVVDIENIIDETPPALTLNADALEALGADMNPIGRLGSGGSHHLSHLDSMSSLHAGAGSMLGINEMEMDHGIPE
jgi:hypothetical protein